MSTYTNLLFHIVFSTKYRKPTICSHWQKDLYAYIGGIVKDQKGTLQKIGGIEDHVHLLLSLSPTHTISDVLRKIKSNSSKWINLRDDVVNRFEWQTGYAAFSVSESQAPIVAKYISNQAEHHKRNSFEDEFLILLRKHGIESDMNHIFEREFVL